MKKTTRVSSSVNGAGQTFVDFKLPEAWPDLTDEELRKICEIIVMMPSGQQIFAIFRALTGTVVERRQPGGKWLMKAKTDAGIVRFSVSPEILVSICEPLSFILDCGSVPVRLEWVCRRKLHAVNAELHGLSFGDYLRLENLYQGYIISRDKAAVDEMATILYPGFNLKKHALLPSEIYAISQWVVQVKAMFSRQFPNFFRPLNGTVEAPSMLEVMNNEIRALTGGDVAKEQEIFEVDCWRALTELDFKAKEAEEYRRQQAKQ